jgi:peptide/nickel transport system substrate-binding protein
MRSRSFVLALAILVVAAAVRDPAAAQFRRELRIGVSGLPAVVDPALAADGAAALVARQLFDTLVAYREVTTDVEPALATRWSVSRDGLVWTFTLRDGVRFHDGTPLTAHAVAASFERHLKPDDTLSGAGVVWAAHLRGVPGVVKEVRAPDPRTVKIVLVQPYAPLLTVLAHPGFGVARSVTAADGTTRLVGTGPYRTVDTSPGRVALETAPGHWSGAPGSERIVILEVAGEDQAEGDLDAGSLDLWFPSAAPRRTSGAMSVPGLQVGYLAFQTEKEPFSRRAVRRAVAAALDPAILGVPLERAAVPLLSFLPPGVWARREGSMVVGAGREAARSLLAEGGWPHGFQPTLLLAIPPGTPDPARLAETVDRLLGAADIPVQLRLESPDVARAALEAGDYELALTEAPVTGGDPHLFLYPLSTSESATKGPRALNYSYYRNPRLDDMLIRASQLGFRVERERLYQRAQATLAIDVPWVPVYVRLHWAVARPELRGFRLHPSGFHRLAPVRLELGASP